MKLNFLGAIGAINAVVVEADSFFEMDVLGSVGVAGATSVIDASIVDSDSFVEIVVLVSVAVAGAISAIDGFLVDSDSFVEIEELGSHERGRLAVRLYMACSAKLAIEIISNCS